jgi:hypothetical protein
VVVRNGYHQQREVVTAAGAVSVMAPRVNDKRVDPYCATVQLQDSAQEFLNSGTGPITCNAATPNQPRAP